MDHCDDAGKVKKLLDRYTCYYTLADPQEGDNRRSS